MRTKKILISRAAENVLCFFSFPPLLPSPTEKMAKYLFEISERYFDAVKQGPSILLSTWPSPDERSAKKKITVKIVACSIQRAPPVHRRSFNVLLFNPTALEIELCTAEYNARVPVSRAVSQREGQKRDQYGEKRKSTFANCPLIDRSLAQKITFQMEMRARENGRRGEAKILFDENCSAGNRESQRSTKNLVERRQFFFFIEKQ